jgi:uncharacterized membrane protein YphA (DoxX/SURF4 family)
VLVRVIPELGSRLYGLAAIAAGVVALVWGQFVQPWHALPDAVPARTIVTYALAVLFVASGAALLLGRGARQASLVLAALYFVFVIGWGIRLAAMHPAWLGVAELSAITLGALASYALLAGATPRASQIARGSRIGFGLCCLVFGAAHFYYAKETATMVPAWLPPGSYFWAHATGIFHAVGGLALVSGVLALLAARLLAAMFVGFGLLVWLPIVAEKPGEQFSWGGNAVNLALVAAAWVVGDAIARFGAGRRLAPSAEVTPAGKDEAPTA